MIPKVLILLGDAGGGHMSNAKAVKASILKLNPAAEVTIIDLSEKVHAFPFNATDPFWQSVSKNRLLEFTSNQLYKLTNTPTGNVIASWVVNRYGYQQLFELLHQQKPDIVISTHFIVSAILEKLKPSFPNLKTVSIAADLVGFPRMLADTRADLVFAPTLEAANRFQKFGVDPAKIRAPYFPVNPALSSFRPRTEFMTEIGLDPNRKLILVTGGGVGTISMLKKIRELIAIPEAQVVVIAGKSKLTFDILTIDFGANPNVRIVKFIDNIQDYFNAADVIVAKPGPATIVEIELFAKPTIFTTIIGKQEEGNIDFLLKNPNFHYLDYESATLSALVKRLLDQPYITFTPRFSFDSTDQIAAMILQLLPQ